MIRNILLVAFRNILRQKTFSVIIVFGLMLGIAIFGLILLYVQSEWQYDRFNTHYGHIYRLEKEDWALLGTAYGPTVAAQFPEIKAFTRISSFDGMSVTVKIGNELKKMENLIYADSGFLDIFTLHFIEGNPDKALKTPFSLILTQSEARRLFGKADPMNKIIRMNNAFDYTVTGIIKDPDHFSVKLNAISYFPTLQEVYHWPQFLDRYDSWNYHTYFLLSDKTDVNALSVKINRFINALPQFKDHPLNFSLRPLSSIYFTALKYDIPSPKANKGMLMLFMAIGFFVLLIACVNFINLTTARAAARSKEIGLRKVIGADRKLLIMQFLGEALLFALIATELSLVFMELFKPTFSGLVQRTLSFSGNAAWWLAGMGLLLPLVTGLLAGLYPAFYLSKLQPALSLKGTKTKGKGALNFRRWLIVFQFAISVFLMASTFTIYRQLNYVKGKNLGFTKDPVITIALNGELKHSEDALRQMLLADPSVKNVSFSTQALGGVTWQESINEKGENLQYTYMGTDPEFIQTMGLETVQGRGFDRSNPSDSGKCIMNEEMVKLLGLKNPVGQAVGQDSRKYEILGVVKDFHFNPLHSPIGPLAIVWEDRGWNTASIRIAQDQVPAAIAHLQSVWNKLCPDYLFEYGFVDESFNQAYHAEDRLAQLFMYFAMLAVLIASIGLFGLSSYLAMQRTREIGVRKSMGASTANVMKLLTTEYVRWVMLSGVFAIPTTFWVMNKWLQQFAYHVQVSWGSIVLAWLLAMIIAVFTVAWQAYATARANPVEALKYE